jgi:hypothetical protein
MLPDAMAVSVHDQRGTTMKTILSILALSAAAAGFAAPASASTSTTTAAPKAKEVKYCLSVEPGTGSRLGGTECLTKSEWQRRGINIDELSRK